MNSTLLAIIETLAQGYIMLIILRFLAQWAQVSYYNNISQALVKLSDPLLRPIKRIIPAYGRFDGAALLLALFLQMLLIYLINYLAFSSLIISTPVVLKLTGIALFKLLGYVLFIYKWALIIMALGSWIVGPDSRHNDGFSFLVEINEPFLRLIRQVIPPIAGLDFSVMVALILIFIIQSVVLQKIFSYLLLM